MFKNVNLVLLSLITGLCTAVSVYAGTMDSGGADIHSNDYGAAWFLGDAPVHYCIETATDFGASTEMVDNQFQKALSTWKTYVHGRGVDETSQLKLGFNYVRDSKCEASTDLTIFAGVSNDRTRAGLKEFQNPIAIAIRETYDSRAGRGKGFIWLRLPYRTTEVLGGHFVHVLDWTKPDTLEGAFTHELGHLLGCGHLPGTVMSESFATWLEWQESRTQFADFDDYLEERRNKLVAIDQRLILFLPKSTGTKRIRFSETTTMRPSAIKPEVFEKYVGRKNVGPIRVTATPGDCQEKGCITLSLSDDAGTTSFEIELIKYSIMESKSLGRAFQRYQEFAHPTYPGGFRPIGEAAPLKAITAMGKTLTKKGELLIFQITVNIENPMSIIQILPDATLEYVFLAIQVEMI